MVMTNMKTTDRNWDKTTFAEIMSPAKVVLCGSRQDLPVLSITMHDGIVEQKDRFKKVIASHDTSKYKVVKNGQLVIAFPIDEGLIYTQDVADEGIMSPAYNVWDVNYENFDRRFLGLYFHSPFAMDYYKGNLRGTTQRRRALPKEALLSMPIPKPTLLKQKEIVAEIGTISSAISLLKKQTSDLDALTKALFLDMFGNPGTNPKDWQLQKLGIVGKIVTGNTPSRNEKEYYNSQFIEWIKTDNIERYSIYATKAKEFLSEEGAKKGRIVNEGSLLVACIAGSFNSIGKACITNRRVAFNQQINAITPKECIDIKYLYYLIQAMNKIIVGYASTGMKHILSKSTMERISIPVPPLSLQQSFASKVTAVEEAKSSLNTQIAEMQTLLASRMQYWFD